MFIERSGDSQAIANAMSAKILAHTGRHVSVALKPIELPPEAEETTVFKLNTQMDFFDEKDFCDAGAKVSAAWPQQEKAPQLRSSGH